MPFPKPPIPPIPKPPVPPIPPIPKPPIPPIPKPPIPNPFPDIKDKIVDFGKNVGG